MPGTSGEFTGTGYSAAIRCRKASISLSFDGTATVQLQHRLDNGDFELVKEYTETPSEPEVYDGGSIVDLRLQCTAHTDNVDYVLSAEDIKTW